MEREQNTSPQLTPEQAQAALRDVEQTRSSYYSELNPWWTTLVFAAFLCGMPLAAFFDVNWTAIAVLGGPLGLGALLWASRRTGPNTELRFGALQYTLLAVGTLVVIGGMASGHFLAPTHGAWVWLPVIVTNGAVALGIDLILRRKARKAA
ncbi:hypothetical protein [Thermobifida cellulosilytica]|uniref:Uncharacterized protein n=1 Tax=Thermobifida cellulosilytica TB100 TaxID=665004 RepID=A0A147KH56_THECS|nr:hypothetical protein [Thermobifida cellulosilytica]KUP96509.1 hypothetical protein AC529_12225 [Thermobifida cellulosilytica TB100]